MTPTPRRKSRLAGDNPFKGGDQRPESADTTVAPTPLPGPTRQVPQPAPPPAREHPVPPAPTGQARLETRSRRRRGGAPIDDMTMVSFNCRMTVACRRAVRTFAGAQDVDIQDVVEEALIQYLGARGIEVPRRPVDQEQPD